MIFRIKTILLDIQDIDIPLLKGEMITTNILRVKDNDLS